MNDFSCTSEKNPVILIPGTTTNIYNDFAKMAPALMNAGYCVYGFNHNPATQFAGHQQLVGSDRINEVYNNGPVKYTMIASKTDQTVTPYTNITVQDEHPGFVSDHNKVTYYEQVIDLALRALYA